jgi:hypothetical protein
MTYRMMPLLMFCFLAGPVLAQENIIGSGVTGGARAPVIYTGPGDVVSGANGWYGLRAYSQAVAVSGHKLINISRASDSHTCDIIVATSGGLGNTANCSTGGDNGQSAGSFCNATTCVAVTLYDQIGTKDVTQATNASRPTLNLNCTNSLPCLQATATQNLTSTGSNIASQPLTMSMVGERTGAFTTLSTIFGGSGANCELGGQNAANTWILFCGTTVGVGSIADSVWHSLNVTANGASTVFNADGNETTISAGANPINNNIFVTNNMVGNVSEAGYWSGGWTTLQRNAMCHNQRLYWGTTGAC